MIDCLWYDRDQLLIYIFCFGLQLPQRSSTCPVPTSTVTKKYTQWFRFRGQYIVTIDNRFPSEIFKEMSLKPLTWNNCILLIFRFHNLHQSTNSELILLICVQWNFLIAQKTFLSWWLTHSATHITQHKPSIIWQYASKRMILFLERSRRLKLF